MQDHSAARVPMPSYTAHHFALTKRDYDAAISSGRRFESIRGEPLATAAEVKEALKADKEVVSR